MLKRLQLAGTAAAIFTLVTLTAVMLMRSQKVHADEGDNDESKIQQGFAIAPVRLHLAGKNRALVGLGSYIVNAQADCNGCHTLNPAVQYTVPGNPFLLSPPFTGKTKVNKAFYLGGGNEFGPFPGGPGSIEHLYTRNLTPDITGMPEGGRPFSEFLEIMRHGTDLDHLHPSCVSPGNPANCLPFPFNGDLLQVMPWPTFRYMTDRDLLAIYTYLSAIPCNPGPHIPGAPYLDNVCPSSSE
jgi:hypothetical protein